MSKARQRVLVLTCQNPLRPNNGAALRVAQNVFALSQNYQTNVLVLGYRNSHETLSNGSCIEEINAHELYTNLSLIGKIVRKIRRILISPPELIERYTHRAIKERLQRQCVEGKHDCVIIEEIALGGYIRIFSDSKLPFIYDAHNVESILRAEIDPNNSKKSRRQQKALMETERQLVLKSASVWACSKRDQNLFAITFNRENGIVVVPNGVNAPLYERHLDMPYDWGQKPITLLYIGTYNYYPNEDAAITLIKDVFPLVLKKSPNAKLIIVGRHPTEKMFEAANQQNGIEITGSVESIHDYLAMPSIFALPIRLGGGTRLKVLEAFASGRPVICSSKACEGIDCKDEEHLFLAETPEDLAQLALKLWHDQCKMERVCKTALQLVENRYSWSNATQAIENNVESILNAPNSSIPLTTEGSHQN